jgi:hypothetical protein
MKSKSWRVSDPRRLKLTHENCVVSFIERISLGWMIYHSMWVEVSDKSVTLMCRSDLHLSVLWEFSETISTRVCDSMWPYHLLRCKRPRAWCTKRRRSPNIRSNSHFYTCMWRDNKLNTSVVPLHSFIESDINVNYPGIRLDWMRRWFIIVKSIWF